MTESRRSTDPDEVTARVASDDEEIVTLMTRFYRDEMRRTVGWRQRLDTTTNWAVIVISALLTWAFSSETNPHYVLLIGVAAAAFLLVLEARRFRAYDVWRSRIRLIETNVFANALDPEGAPAEDWRRRLASDLRRPAYRMRMRIAMRHRLRHVYLALLLLLLVAWVVRITAFDPGAQSLDAAAIGDIPGGIVVTVVSAFYALSIGLALWPLDGDEREIRGRTDDVDD